MRYKRDGPKEYNLKWGGIVATVAEIQKLYDLGKIPEALAAIWVETHERRTPDDPEIGQLRVIRAWCHWCQQEWGDALMWLEAAEEAGGAELQAKRLRAQEWPHAFCFHMLRARPTDIAP